MTLNAVIDRPDIDEELLAAQVRAGWDPEVASVAFLPLGLDGRAWAYAVMAGGVERYFLKVRAERAPIEVPQFLRTAGLNQVVAPIGETAWSGYQLLLYPFVPGSSRWEPGLTDAQWIDYGTFLGALHAAVVPSGVEVRTETFASTAPDRLRALSPAAATSDFAAHWHAREIEVLARRVTDLERQAAAARHPFVLCHADIHPGNLMAEGDGPLSVVDWDAPILAPRELDLMFVLGTDFGEHPINAHREALFRQGYGHLEVDETVLDYYRQERIADDIAVFAASLLADPPASAESRANDLHWLTRLLRALPAR